MTNAEAPTQPQPRRARPVITLEVVRTETLTPHMIRVVLGGDGFDDFTPNEFTDAYVKLAFPRPSSEPIDWLKVADLPQDQRPISRTYTVRSVDPVARELAIDFVVHGDEGIAGPWANAAQPGDLLHFMGPSGAYAPRADVDWHLFVGDEAALPAIAAALEALPSTAVGIALLEVDDAAHEMTLETLAAVDIRWLHRTDPAHTSLLDAVTALTLPPGTGQGFVHGELRAIRQIRKHLLAEDRFTSELLSISGYWSQGKTEDGFQAEKRAGGA